MNLINEMAREMAIDQAIVFGGFWLLVGAITAFIFYPSISSACSGHMSRMRLFMPLTILGGPFGFLASMCIAAILNDRRI